jgi:hypothetical protein
MLGTIAPHHSSSQEAVGPTGDPIARAGPFHGALFARSPAGDGVMGKKAKQDTESKADRERIIEAIYFARKCGLTKEEAIKILEDARGRIDDEAGRRSGDR